MFRKTFSKKLKASKGFTLIELLIVIAIIAIIAAVVFVALDPLTRFRDARDSNRWTDVSAILSAIKVDQVDNRGAYLAEITTDGTSYMIGTETTGCNVPACDVTIVADGDCVNLTGLVTEGYLGEVPISPDGEVVWNASTTGYVLTASATGIITIQACEAENAASISISR